MSGGATVTKKDVVIFGNTGFSAMVKKSIDRYADYSVVAFCVDAEYISGDMFEGIPIVAYESIEETYPADKYDILITVGYKKMNGIRQKTYHSAKEKGYCLQNFIHPKATVESNLLGEGNIILANADIGMDATIGNCNFIWNGCIISHDACIGDFNYFAPGAILGGNVTVHDRCFLGLGSIVKNGCVIETGTLVGAGCYISNSTNEYEVWVPERSSKLQRKSDDEELL